MNDLEWRRALRRLNAPHAPQRDLWPDIATRIATADAGMRGPARSWHRALPAIAAGVVLALGALGAFHATAPTAPNTPALHAALRPDKTQAPNGDPRLLAGAIVLDAAHAELEQALQLHPDSPLLANLLQRTQERRARLNHYGMRAG